MTRPLVVVGVIVGALLTTVAPEQSTGSVFAATSNAVVVALDTSKNRTHDPATPDWLKDIASVTLRSDFGPLLAQYQICEEPANGLTHMLPESLSVMPEMVMKLSVDGMTRTRRFPTAG